MIVLPPPPPPPTFGLVWFMVGLLTAVCAGLVALWYLTFRQLRLLADIVLKQQQALAQLEPKTLCTFTVEMGTAQPPPTQTKAN